MLDVLNNVSVHGLLETLVVAKDVVRGLEVGSVSSVGVNSRLERLVKTLVRGSGKENDLAVGRLGHSLHSLEVTDLHGGGGAQDIGSLAHELGGFDLCLGGNDLTLTNTLALSSHGKRLLELLGEDNILDEHALDLDTPSGGDILDDLSDGLGNFLTALNDVLENAGTDNVAQGGLGTLHKSLADVGNAKGSLVGADNVVVDDGCELERDIVLGHANLLGDFSSLNFNVDLDKGLAQRVDLNQTGVDSTVEAAKLGNKTNITLLDTLVRVGAADAAWDSTHGTDASTETVDYKREEVVSETWY